MTDPGSLGNDFGRVLEGFPLLQHVETSCSVNPANSSSRRSGSKGRRSSNGGSTSTAAAAAGTRTAGTTNSIDNELARNRSIIKTTSYMCAKTEDEERAFQNAVAGRQIITHGSGRPVPPVYVVADGEGERTEGSF